jgi:alpha-glucosidase (family GH31 glycosyl hydrolase)
MKAYYIVDKATGNRWAHNKWATPTAIPDFYKSYASAHWQVFENGKVYWMTKRKPAAYQVDIRIAELIF